MQEMIEIANSQPNELLANPDVVQLVSDPFLGSLVFAAGPAQFGPDLQKEAGVLEQVVRVEPSTSCVEPTNAEQVRGRIAIVSRGNCMFIEKARVLQSIGAVGMIVIGK